MSTPNADAPIVLRLTGDVDALTQAGFRAIAAELLAAPMAALVVDMSDVRSIDSSGLGLLVHLQSVTKEKGIAMALAHVPPRARALLTRTGLDRVFPIAPDTQDA